MIVGSENESVPKSLRSKSNYSLSQRSRIRFALTAYMRKFGLSYQATCEEIWAVVESDLSDTIKDKTQIEDFVKGSEPRDDKLRAYSTFLKAVEPEYAAFLFEDDMLEKVAAGVNTFAYGSYIGVLDDALISEIRSNAVSGFYIGVNVRNAEPEIFSIFAHAGTNIFSITEYELRDNSKDSTVEYRKPVLKSSLTSLDAAVRKAIARSQIGEREIIVSDRKKEDRKFINIALDGELGDDLPEEMDHPSELAEQINIVSNSASQLFDDGHLDLDKEHTRLCVKSSGFVCLRESTGLMVLRDSYRPKTSIGFLRTSLIDFEGKTKTVLELDTLGLEGPNSRDVRKPTKSVFVKMHSKVLNEFLLRTLPIRI